MQQLIVGVDGSEASIDALRWAARLAKDTAATLTVVHVRHIPAIWSDNPSAFAAVEPYLEELEQSARDAAAEVLGGVELPVAFEVRDGDPTDELDRAATAHQADAIVVSGHGNRGINRLLLGSVSSRLVHTASVTVIVVR